MNKIPCASQNTETETLPADVCIFGHLGGLSSAAVHSSDSWFDSRVKWWIHISSIVTYLCKTSFLLPWNSCKQYSEPLTGFCFWSTVSKRSTHFEHRFLLTNYHAKWWIHCLLITSIPLLSHTTSIYYQPRQVRGVFWCFQGQLPNLDDQRNLCQYDHI